MKKPEAGWLNMPTDAAALPQMRNGQHQGGCDDLYQLNKVSLTPC